MNFTRAQLELAHNVFHQHLGEPYVYGGLDCSGLVDFELTALTTGTVDDWERHVTTESWSPDAPMGGAGPFGSVRVPNNINPGAVAVIAIHHGGGGPESHMNVWIDGELMESNGDHGICGEGSGAIPQDDDYWTDWWAIFPTGVAPSPPPLSRADGYALAIIREGQRRGITPRGIQIALATALVESNLTMYANSNVPESLNIPHDAVGSDHDSVGLFQQRCPMWGPANVLMDPGLSSGLFYDHLVQLDYNGDDSPGSYAQAVQRSAFPDRYDQRFGEAVDLYNRLAAAPPSVGVELTQEEHDKLFQVWGALFNRKPSNSRYSDPSILWSNHEFIGHIDGFLWDLITEHDAALGNAVALGRVQQAAASGDAVAAKFLQQLAAPWPQPAPQPNPPPNPQPTQPATPVTPPAPPGPPVQTNGSDPSFASAINDFAAQMQQLKAMLSKLIG